jgi:3-dehydroquinate dehydratase
MPWRCWPYRLFEVHISNVYRREAFRHTSVVAPIATGQIAGLGWHGYLLALEWLIAQLGDSSGGSEVLMS